MDKLMGLRASWWYMYVSYVCILVVNCVRVVPATM